MSRGAIVRRIEDVPEDLLPGAHVVLLSSDPTDGIGGRRFGLELRDTVLVLAPGGASFAFLFRKGFEGTVAENVLATGTGAINIDGTRVGYAQGEVDFNRQQRQQQSARTIEGAFGAAALIGKEIPTYKPEGRWPSNLVLSHSPECEKRGESYDCADGCPVAAMDEQSGVLKTNPSTITTAMGFHGGAKSGSSRVVQGDSGGASRFFPQFEGEAAFLAWLTRLIGLAV